MKSVVFLEFGDMQMQRKLRIMDCIVLQHRGQEGAGIVVSDGDELSITKGEGLVTEIFTADKMQELSGTGKAAIGHVRYATAGGGGYQNVQPLLFNSHTGSLHLLIMGI